MMRVHTDICARCGCDRKEQRRGQFRCKANGVLYSSHKWGWDAVEEAGSVMELPPMPDERERLMESRPEGAALPKGLDEVADERPLIRASWKYALEHTPPEPFFEDLLDAAFKAGAAWREAQGGELWQKVPEFSNETPTTSAEGPATTGNAIAGVSAGSGSYVTTGMICATCGKPAIFGTTDPVTLLTYWYCLEHERPRDGVASPGQTSPAQSDESRSSALAAAQQAEEEAHEALLLGRAARSDKAFRVALVNYRLAIAARVRLRG